LACGSGASAVLAAAYINGKCGPSASILLRGGELFIELDEQTGEIFMTGGAESVFDGVI
jgi:diaminopimelate epimerase